MTEPRGGRAGIPMVDEAKLAADLREAPPPESVFRSWGRSFLLFLLILVVMDLVSAGWSGLSGWLGGGLWVRLAIAWVVATLATWWGWRSLVAPPDERARSLVREWDEMTAPGWPLRAVKLGVRMGVFMAIPVGAFMAWFLPGQAVSGGARLLVFGMFLGATLLWTIPMAFLIRHMAMTSYRRYLREADEGPPSSGWESSPGGVGSPTAPEGASSP
jgi:hypothetical protein